MRKRREREEDVEVEAEGSGPKCGVEREKMDEKELTAARRTREVVRVIKVFCQLLVRKVWYRGSIVARFLGRTTSLANWYTASAELVGRRVPHKPRLWAVKGHNLK